MGNLYGSGLASVMTVTRYEQPIDTVQRLTNSQLLWGATSVDYCFSILSTEDPVLRRFIEDYTVLPTDKCASLAKELKMSLVVEQLQYG